MPTVPRAGASAPAPVQSLRVLVVEDNAVNQRVARRMLERMGHAVEIAENGKIAVERCAQDVFDLVLMDCQMPVMDGLSATRELRRREASRALPIVAMTANAMPGDREACSEAGMDDFLSKPVTLDALSLVLKRVSERPGASGSWVDRPRASRKPG